MPTGRSMIRGAFEPLKEQVRRRAEQWTNSVHGQPLPVPIQELARAIRIRGLVFRPLLSTAALKRAGDGYLIVLNPLADRTPSIELVEVPPDRWSTFKGSLRFSIAHEMVHVMFYEAVGGEIDADLFTRHWKALETACNEIAGALLLPKRRLLAELGQQDLDIPTVRSLVKLFGVSTESFLRRLQQDDMRRESAPLDGFLTVVRKDGKELRLVAPYIRGDRGTGRFRVQDGAGFHELGLPEAIEGALREGAEIDQKVKTRWRDDEFIECQVISCRISEGPLRFLVSLRVVAGPEKYNLSESI